MSKSQNDINFEKFITYDEETNIGQCLVPECHTVFIGRKRMAIKRHYRIAHKLHIEGDNSVPIMDDDIHNSDIHNQANTTGDGNPLVLYSIKYLDDKSNGNNESNNDLHDNCEEKGYRTFLVADYVDYQKDTNISKCLIKNCERPMSGRRTGNIKRHYHKVHNFVIVHDKQETIRAMNRELMDYYNSEVFGDGSRIEEDNNDKEISDGGEGEQPVDFEQYIDYDPLINKSLCKVPGCKAYLAGKKPFSIKRHYGLVHNYDIESNGMKLFDRSKYHKISSGPLFNSSLIPVDDLVVYDTESSSYECLFINCNQVLEKNLLTIKRHYHEVHRIIIARDSDNIPHRFYRKRKHRDIHYQPYESEYSREDQEFVNETEPCFIKHELLSDDEQPGSSKRPNNNFNYYTKENEICSINKEKNTRANLKEIMSNTQNTRFIHQNSRSIQITLTKSKILQLCLGLIIERDLPMDLFDDDKYFKPLLAPYEQLFGNPINSTIMEDLLLKANNIIADDLKKIFTDKIVCLELHVVKRENNYYLTINVRFLEKEMVCNKVIGFLSINEATTSLPIAEYLSKFEIDEQQVYMKTIITAFQDDEEIYKICDNLCKHNPDVKSHPIYDIQKILKTFEQKYSEDIKSWQTLNHYDNDSNKSFRDNLKDFGKQLENLSETDIETNSNHLQEPKYFFKALQIFWTFMDKLAGEQYVAGDLYRDWLCCELELKAELSKNNNTYAGDLHEKFNAYKKSLLESSEFISALYLDARFNFLGSRLLTDNQKTKGKLFLCAIWEKYKNYIQTTNSKEDSKPNNTTDNDDSNDDEYALLTQHINDTMPIKSSTSREDKLTNCVATKREPFSLDILKYWRYNRQDMDDINELARIVFTHSASQYVLIGVQKNISVHARNAQKFDKFLIKFNHNILEKNIEVLLEDLD